MSVQGVAPLTVDTPIVATTTPSVAPATEGERAVFSKLLQQNTESVESVSPENLGEGAGESVESMALLASMIAPPTFILPASEKEATSESLGEAQVKKKASLFNPDLILGDVAEENASADPEQALAEEEFSSALSEEDVAREADDAGQTQRDVRSSKATPTIFDEGNRGVPSSDPKGDSIARKTVETHIIKDFEKTAAVAEKTAEGVNISADKPKIEAGSPSTPDHPVETSPQIASAAFEDKEQRGREGNASEKDEPLGKELRSRDSKLSQTAFSVGNGEDKNGSKGNVPSPHASPLLSFEGISSIEKTISTSDAPQTTPSASSGMQSYQEQALGRGLERTLQFLREDGVAGARIIVDPPALGRVDVSLQVTDKGIEALFRVDNEALRQAVQSQLDQLKQHLAQQGVQTTALSVDIRHGDERDRGAEQAQKKLKRSNRIETEEESLPVMRLDLEKGLLHWVG